MIDVYWGEDTVTIFTQDLAERGISEPESVGKPSGRQGDDGNAKTA